MSESNSSPKSIQIFYSYSHVDEELRNKLETHLSGLKRQGIITGWHDRKIVGGTDWGNEIDAHLNSADIILLLISADFIASDYCYGTEVTLAMRRHEEGKARVVPIILRPADWKGAPFGKLQALPLNAKPVAMWQNPDEAFLNIVEGIRAITKELNDGSSDGGAAKESAPPSKCFNNLPAPLTPFIGRQKEVAAVEKLLLDANVRVVVLNGDGGSGKSRLAQHVTANLAKEFGNGVCLVLLERISDPELVLPTIARTLRIREVVGTPTGESLKLYLEDKQMLLLLDNFEHVDAAAKHVAALLEGCPRLKLLLTSRKLLRIRGARNYSVPPLGLPEEGAYTHAEGLSQYDAVRLFIQSASVIDPDFAVTNENAPAVAELCVRLGGLPLAIELAAARINRFSPDEMLEKLNLNLLEEGALNSPERQQTMRATIAWSYDLLSEDEKKLFRRVSIFRQGCTPEAVAGVCDINGDFKVNVENGLESLVENNLLRRDGMGWGKHRYKMLDMIREYGRECLSGAESEALRQQHAAYFLAFAEEGAAKITSAERDGWLERFDSEHENLRAVLDRCYQSNVSPEIGLRLTGALFWFWNLRSHFTEGRTRVEKALEQGKQLAGTAARAKALSCAGGLSFLQGDSKAACLWYRESLNTWRALGDKPEHRAHLGYTLSIMSQAVMDQKDTDQARSLATEAVGIFEGLEDEWGLALSNNDLGNVLRGAGDYPAALERYGRSLALWRKIDDTWGLPLTLSNMGFLASLQGDYRQSRLLLAEALKIQRKVEDKWGLAETLKCLGDVALHLDDPDEAEGHYRESLMLNRAVGRKQLMVACLEGLAMVAGVTGRAGQAAQLFGAAESLRGTVGVPINLTDQKLKVKYESLIGAVSAQFRDEGEFKSAQSKGREMKLEQATAYALNDSAVGRFDDKNVLAST
jgi:predicted ATPase